MDKIEFGPDLRTGIDDIDEQHHTLIEVYNELVEAVEEHRANRVMNEVLARLFQYAKVHFDAEEILLEKHGYEKLEEHREQHRRLIKEIRRYVFRHTRGGERVSAEVVDFLRNWVTEHIRVHDMAYVGCVQSREGSPPRETTTSGA